MLPVPPAPERQRIAAYGVVPRRDGRLLLARASSSLTLRGRWFLPGGGVDHGEDPRESVRREIEEESGLDVTIGSLLDVLSDVRTIPDGTSLHTVRLIYRVDSRGRARCGRRWTARPTPWPGSPPTSCATSRWPATCRPWWTCSCDGGRGAHHVVIIGCGFGGLFAARALKHQPVRVTLVDRTNHHLFQPLLYQVATGILSEGQIAPAIRDVLRNYQSLEVVLAEVEGVDVDARQVHADEFGQPLTIGYDSLIVAGGAATSYFGHDEFRESACGMKSLDDALELRGQIFGAFEEAEAEEDDDARRALMTFVVVGGGPTGVEMAGQLRELSRRALRRNYRRIDPQSTRVVLVEGTDRLVGTMGRRLSAPDRARPHPHGGGDPPGRHGHRHGRVRGGDHQVGRHQGADPGRHQGVGRRDGCRRAGPGRRRGGGRRARQGGAGAGRVRLLAPRAPRGLRGGRPDGPRRPARRGRGGHAVGGARRRAPSCAVWRAADQGPSATATWAPWP